MKKRLLAWLLCALMIAALLPSFALAEDEPADDVWFEAESTPESEAMPTPDAVAPEIETEQIEAEEPEAIPVGGDKEPAGDAPRTDIVSGEMCYVGTNTFTISNGGDRLFKMLYAPVSGSYRIYSTGSLDTYGSITVGGTVYTDDDGGTGLNFQLNVTLEAGEMYSLGVNYFNSSTTGTITVIVELATDPIYLGSNTYTVQSAGQYIYRPFIAPQTGTYRFYSTGSIDTFGHLTDNCLNQIAYDDDGAGYPNFLITYDLSAGEKVYLCARYFNSDQTGSINVVVEFASAAPTPTPTPTPYNTFNGTVEWNRSDVEFRGTTAYKIYNGSAHTPRFTVKDANGSTVSASNYTYYFSENTQPGTAYLTLNFSGAYTGTYRASFKIYLPATTQTTVENVDSGIRVTWQPVQGAAGYVIYRRAWSTTTNGWTSFARWNNTTSTSYIDGIDDAHKVYAGTRYQYGVKAYFARRTDPVSGQLIGGNVNDNSGNFNLGLVGPLKTTVRITSRRLTELVPASKQLTAKWEASKNFTGYQVQIATNSGFTSGVKTNKVTSASSVSSVFKSLTNSTTYYARVRSYHEFEGMTYYGAWSNVLSNNPGSSYAATLQVRRAVLVGQNNYTTANVLRGPINDMNTMASTLEGLKYRFSTKRLSDANKSDILNAISSTFANATDDDVSLFFYSGHGLNVIGDTTSDYYKQNQGALCMIDGGRITFSELAAAFANVKGKVIFIISSCHSGASIGKGTDADDEIELFVNSAMEILGGRSEENARLGELKQSRFYVITAANRTESGWEYAFDGSGYRQTALAAAILKGIGGKYTSGSYAGSMPADKDKNSAITLKELYNYAYDLCYKWTNISGTDYTPQHVQYYGTDGYVLFRR